MIKKIIKLKEAIDNNKVIKLIMGICKGIAFFILLCLLVIILVQKIPSSKNISVFGIRIYNVATGSMEPVYKVGDIIFIKKTEGKDIEIGDDVTFDTEKIAYEGFTITHRVIDKKYDEEDKQYHFITKGVANTVEDEEITQSQIYGKVIYKSVLLSFISKLTNNIVTYFIIVLIIGVSLSLQIVTEKFSEIDEEDEEDDEDDSNGGEEEE